MWKWSWRTLCIGAAVVVVVPAALVMAIDVDGGNDCERDIIDYGDAPECIPAYPTGMIGQFPTCNATCGAGTQEVTPLCPPISTPPGPTGFVRHEQFGPGALGNFWLGCFADSVGPSGIDTEFEGKVATPAVGISACDGTTPTDCVELAFGGMTFDQDECTLDGSDAGVTAPISFRICRTRSFPFDIFYCGPMPQIEVFLNVLVDWTQDGDWNDSIDCPDTSPPLCAYEWAVVNVPLVIVPGCNSFTTPAILAGPIPGDAWLRISITQGAVPPDYPWAGSAGMAGGRFFGGETEDYPIEIVELVPTQESTWGQIKEEYR